MCISYSDYKKSGYSVIPGKTEFARYSDTAERKIKRFVRNFDCISGITEENKRCVYEIADILYAAQNHPQLAGFGNENYREQYFRGSDSKATADEKIFEMLRLYFTREELYRGA
jgi:hypothetical protein